MVTVGTPRTFEDARAFCGTDKYLLNLHAAVNVSHVQATFQQNGLDSSYVWLNLRMIQGFFHWLDPIPQLFKQTLSLSYGDVIDSYNYHHGCVVLNTSSGAIETRSCDEQHQFVCIEDKQLRPLDVSDEAVSVELTSNQPPVLLSWNLHNLRLTCRAKLRNGTVLREAPPGSYAYAHVWTKNGVFLDHTYPSLQPEKASEPNAYTHSDVSSQGRYRCGLKALPSGSIAWSNVVTVVLEDFDTYRLTGHLSHTVDAGPIQFIGGSFVGFARKIEEAVTALQFSVRWSYSGITIDDADRVNISLFIYYKRPELASIADASGGEPDVFNHSTALENLRTINNITINNITDVLHCNIVRQGVFTFHSEGHVGLVESTPPCLTESNHLVPRYCDINFESAPTWAPFQESTCKAETRSRAFDVHTDTHHLLCSPRHCVPQTVFGAWSEVRRLCNSLRGFLASGGSGSWADIVQKHGYFQSESAGLPQVLEAFKISELLVPIRLPEGANATGCFIVSKVKDQPQTTQYSDSVTQTSCSDERAGSCAFRYRSHFRGLNPCPRGGWLDLSTKNTCLWLNLSPLDYDQAAEKCRASNGHLAFVDNSSLSYTLALLLAPRQVPREFDRYWIGLQRSPGGVYKWENGDPMREFAWHPQDGLQAQRGNAVRRSLFRSTESDDAIFPRESTSKASLNMSSGPANRCTMAAC
ncbi:uncharacterized protein LOC119443027 isoform X4 [Dermacentor silvarum]|uniref:uncharacterized protein LOC119443027 isoform X4 n=1 Tax=Dermacentor silvarum TaxID=543639 RepID=UPI002100C8FC|nr:uncharacterized protein LOC119443027 isoform X4 [Dermacentor silvarum]